MNGTSPSCGRTGEVGLYFYFHIFKRYKDFFFRLNKVALEMTKACIEIISVSLYNKRKRERKARSRVLNNVFRVTGGFMHCDKCVRESYIVSGVSPLPAQYHVAVLSYPNEIQLV
jgi:hypothetical protein